MKTVVSVLLLTIAALLCASTVDARTVKINSELSSSEINAVILSLKAGDELRFDAGTYTDVSLDISISGTSDNPITICGSPDLSTRPILSADVDADDENYSVRLRSGVKFITIKDLEFRHKDGASQVVAGIYFGDNVHDIEIDNCILRDITGVGIEMHDQDNIFNVEIKDTRFVGIAIGTSGDSEDNLGCAISAGSTSLVATANVHDIEVDHCVFEDIRGTLGAAVSFQNGVYQSEVKDCVTFDLPKGSASAEFTAAIDVRPGLKAVQSKANNIVIKGNAILDSVKGEANSIALNLAAGVDAFNNLIVNAQTGIKLSLLATLNLKNTRIAQNTVINVTGSAMVGLSTGLEDDSFIVANNVFYVGASISDRIGYSWTAVTDLGSAVIKSNFYRGQTVVGEIFEDLEAMVELTSNNVNTYFTNADARIGAGASFVAKGDLLNAGIDINIDSDYDDNERDESQPDCGCYEADGDHSEVDYDFKKTSDGGDGGDGDGDGSSAANIKSVLLNLF